MTSRNNKKTTTGVIIVLQSVERNAETRIKGWSGMPQNSTMVGSQGGSFEDLVSLEKKKQLYSSDSYFNVALNNYYYINKIERAMAEWMEKVPCLRFVKRTNQQGYLHFISGEGYVTRAFARGFILEGYSYLRVLPGEFLLKKN